MKRCFCIFALFFACASALPLTGQDLRSWMSMNEIMAAKRSVNQPGKTMAELVMPQGYPLEEYEVVTADGYILTVFRIPYGKNSSTTPRRPILLQHGIFATSASWVISEPHKGLGFVLADAGYDVWLPNSRGSTYSKKHIKYNPDVDKQKFFDYSFHEMGYYDLPAVIDFILTKTNNSQIDYAGHSQGTTQFFVLTSVHPEYNQKVRVAALMAPIAYLDHSRGTVKILTAFGGVLSRMAKFLGIYEILSNSPLIHFIDTSLCRKTAITSSLCDNLLFAMTGFDTQQFNQFQYYRDYDTWEGNPHIFSKESKRSINSRAEIFNSMVDTFNELLGGKFTMYDYGSSENKKIYGLNSPPEYDLSKITVPINLHYSLNDWLAGVSDVLKIHNHLAHSTLIEVPFPAFNHLDFMWAKDVTTLLYNDMIRLLLLEE